MTPGASDVTVVIRTYDSSRWSDLACAVESVRRQTTPGEIVVVVDHNAPLLARARRELVGVRVVENAGARGASGGMNSGIAAAQKPIVAFLDDDAEAAPHWLEHLVQPYDDPRVLGVGGRIEPAWLAGRPAWFPSEFHWVVGCTFPGGFDAPGPVRSLIGANMSFRRSIFDHMPGFRTDVGAVGSTLTKCEDTEFCIRVCQRWPESVLVYQPQAVVMHRVPPQRATWRYFGARCLAEGLAKAQIAALVGRREALASERRYVRQTLPRAVRRSLGEAARRGDGTQLLQVGAVAAGLTCAAAGYALGTARHLASNRLRRPCAS